MGQGMMSGYRDAINLYWKLNFVLKKSFPENILKTYNVERRPHAQFIVEGSAAIGKLMEAYSMGSRDDTIDEIPEEVINRGYGSFRIPGLEKGILFNQSSCNNPLIGELFPQPIQFHNTKIKERNDKILGDDFSILSKIDINIKKRTRIKNLPKFKKQELGIVFENTTEETKKQILSLFNTNTTEVEEKEDYRFYFSNGINYIIKFLTGTTKALKNIYNIKELKGDGYKKQTILVLENTISQNRYYHFNKTPTTNKIDLTKTFIKHTQ